MQNQNKLSTRILSLALSAAMALTSFPVAAFAVEGNTPPQAPSGNTTTTRAITAFGELGEGFEKPVPFDGHTYVLNVNANTPFAEVKLPTELSVTVEKATTTTPPAKDEPVAEPTAAPVAEPTAEPVAEPTAEPVAEPTAEPVAEPVAEPTAEPKQENTIVIETTQENLAVTWKGDKEYTAAENSTVVYTPVLPEGYVLKDGVALPTINVMVGKNVIAATPRAAKGMIVWVDSTKEGLQKAIERAAEGDTLMVQDNIDLIGGNVTVPQNKTESFTININGYTLTSSGTTIIHNGAGTLTIDDGSFNIDGGTSGIVQTTSTRPGDYAIQNGGAGTVSVVKGTVHAIGVIAIGSTSTGTGAISVSGGTVSSDKSNAIYSRSTGTITVSGGTVSSNIGNAISNNKTGTINISGGKVSSNSGSAIWNDSTGAITVSGTAELTSACTDERLGTIFLPTSTAGQEILKISGNAVVKHTGDGSINKSAIRTDGAGIVSISGGTVSSNACSAIFNYGTGTINVSDCTVTTTTGTAIRNARTGTINVSGSAVSTTTGDAIWNSGIGAINVRDGIVSATTGTAIKNSKTGVITVGGTAEVTSQNTAWNGGTIYFGEVPTTGVIFKVEDKAQVKNTAAEEGYSAFFYPLNLTPVTVKNYYTVAEGAKLGKVYPMPPKIISFDARNGDAINDVRISASMQLPSNPSRWGYDFGGWYDGIDGTDAPEGLVGELTLDKAKALSAGIKVYAKWTKDGKTLRTTPLDLTGAVTAAPDQGWTWDVDKKILTLNGATIMSENSIGSTGSSNIELYAVKLPTGATITLAEGSKSDIIGGNCISSDALDIRSCGIYVNDATSGILTINGTGTLNTRGGGVFYNQVGESCGIFSADKINIVSGTVNATGGTVVSTYNNTDTFSSSIGISTDQLSAVAIAIGKDATVNATGGEATYTCKNGPSDGFAMSDGISSTENISNDGKLTAVGDTAICNGADGKRISDKEKSYGTLSDTATFSATAVTSVKGKTAAISTINGITASKAFIIGANETSFTSGVTKTLTQADQTVPVEIVFTKVVTFDARNGAATTKVETDGDTIIMPSNPKWGDNAAKDNYTFAGWYTGIDGAGEAFVNENLAVRTTVYAKWTKDGKTVRTEALDLSTATASIDKLAAEGWSWDSSSSTLTLNGATIMGENSVGAIGTGRIELYAVKLPPVATINLVEGSESNLIGGNCTGSNASGIKSCGIYANDYNNPNILTINGTGTLNTRGGDILNNQNGESCGIFTVGEINIVSGTVNATGGAVVSKSDYPNSSSKGIQLDGKFEIGEKATVNAIGGKASSTCTSDYDYSMATSYGIYNDYEISNKGNLTVVGDTAIFEDKNGNPVIDNQTSCGIESNMITCISPAVISAKGETIAIYTYTRITAEGASVTNGTADNVGGKFESDVTTALTQTDTTKPVKISFGPSISVAAQSGKATYGTVASPTFAVTGSGFGGNYPAFAPSVVWTSGSAPKGVTTTFSGTNNETLTVKTTANTPADTYKFKVVSAKTGGGNYESAEVTLKVDKLTAAITWTGTSLTYNGKAQAPTATVSNKIGNDDVTVTVTGEKKDVGIDITATASAFEGAAAANYAMPSTVPTTLFAITAKKVTVTDGDLVVKKAFDGKNDAGTVTGGKLGLTDVVGTDDVSVKVDIVGNYADSNVGKNKTVTLNISLEGTTAGNYTLGLANTYKFKNAEITKVAYSGTKANAPDGTPENKGDKSITIKAVTPPDSEKVEYAVSKANTAPTLGSDWQDGTTFNNLNPNTTYYFFARVKESNNHAPGGESTGTSITTDKSEYAGTQSTAPNKTADKKTDISITLKAVTPPDGETVEYGIDKNNDGTITWQTGSTFDNLAPNTEYKFYTRVKENNTHKAGAASDVTKIKTDKVAYAGTEATAPNASKISKTDTTVTLEAQTPPLNETIEYGYSDSATGTITWKDSNAFTGLSANTEYFFFARVKENDKHMAGATSASITIKTDKVAYTGTQSTAPNKIADKKTDISITLKAVTPPDGEAVEYGIDKNNDGTITWQTGSTFDNLASNTEYKFYTRVKENNTHKAGATSAATTIKTDKAPVDVDGTVTDSTGVSLDNVLVELKQGDTVIKSATTAADGKYILTAVPAGVYKLVITKGTAPKTVTITETVTVDGTPITGHIVKFLNGDKNTIVDSKPGAPTVAVDGMNDLLNDANIDKTLTPEEKAAVDANGSVELKFTADLKPLNENVADKSELESIAGNQKIDLLLDLSVLKIVKDASGNTVTDGEKITDLAGIIEVYLPIPANVQGKAGLSLYRMHNGKPEKLSTKPDANGEYYTIDKSGEFMTLYLKKFSTYAMGYNAFTVAMQNGGTGASGNGNYSNGDTVTINAGTKSGYSFSGWTVTVGNVTLANPSSATTTFTMPAENVVITAGWTATGGNGGSGGNGGNGNGSTETYCYIKATAGIGGSINTPERVKVQIGESAGFSITPDKGYQIADVKVNGKSIGAKKYYVFTNVLSDQTIHATFKKAGHANPQTGVSVD